MTPLHLASQHAAKQDHVHVVKLLLSAGADISRLDKFGRTPLHWASRNDAWPPPIKTVCLYIVKFLVSSGADIHCTDNDGWTPLHWASYFGRLEVVKFLLSLGAHISCENAQARNALHVASDGGRVEVVKFLLSSGADINSTDNDGMAPLHLASRAGHLKVVKCLLMFPTGQGNLLLDSSETDHSLQTLSSLTSRPLNIVAEKLNNDGATPSFLALQHGHTWVLKYLLSMGASMDDIMQSDISPWLNAEDIKKVVARESIWRTRRRHFVMFLATQQYLPVTGRITQQCSDRNGPVHQVLYSMDLQRELSKYL